MLLLPAMISLLFLNLVLPSPTPKQDGRKNGQMEGENGPMPSHDEDVYKNPSPENSNTEARTDHSATEGKNKSNSEEDDDFYNQVTELSSSPEQTDAPTNPEEDHTVENVTEDEPEPNTEREDDKRSVSPTTKWNGTCVNYLGKKVDCFIDGWAKG